MNNFIISGKGFFKSSNFDIIKKETVIEWTNMLIEAKRFTSKTAQNIIIKNNLDAFIWNPYKIRKISHKL